MTLPSDKSSIQFLMNNFKSKFVGLLIKDRNTKILSICPSETKSISNLILGE